VAEPSDVFAGGLIGDAEGITNFVKGKARLLSEELEDLNSPMIRDTLHNFLSEFIVNFIHKGLNWVNGEKLRSFDDLFPLCAKGRVKVCWEVYEAVDRGK